METRLIRIVSSVRLVIPGGMVGFGGTASWGRTSIRTTSPGSTGSVARLRCLRCPASSAVAHRRGMKGAGIATCRVSLADQTAMPTTSSGTMSGRLGPWLQHARAARGSRRWWDESLDSARILFPLPHQRQNVGVRRIGNVLILWLLGSPLHRILSAKVAVVAYQGRRSGAQVRLPVQYAALKDQIIVFPAHASSKRWWRNFEQPHSATLLVAGRSIRVVGAVVRDAGPLGPLAEAYELRFSSTRDIDLVVVFTPARR